MKVSFNPSVSFRQNLIEQRVAAQQTQTGTAKDEFVSSPKVPSSEPLPPEVIARYQKEWEATMEEGKSLDGIIKGTHWEKVYSPETDSVHIKIPNSYDGAEFTIKSDGTVIKESGWSNPEIILKNSKNMADYVKAMKEGKVDEYLKAEELSPKNGNPQTSDKSKEELFKETLHNRQWKKEYLPESDIIVISNKKIQDGVDYMMEKDGTVKEFGTGIKPTVIIEPSIEGVKEFGKLKAKLSGEKDQPNSSAWYKMKNAVANIWKFFTVTGTMATATAKGVAEGVVAGVGVLAGTTLLRGAYKVITTDAKIKDVAKHPFKTAGKAGALLAAIAGGAVLAGEIIAGRMKANQKSAVIEHKLDVAHDLT